MGGPLPGPRAHCAQHVQARHTRHVARLPRTQRRTPAPVPPRTRPPRRRLGCRPTTASGWPGRRSRARSVARHGAGAAQVQDALWPAARTGALDRLDCGGRHVGAAPTARPPLLPSSKQTVAPFPNQRRHHRRSPAPPSRRRRSRRQASRSRRRHPATWALRWSWALRWWAGRCSTGGPMMAASAAPSLAFVRAGPSRTWWPTPGIRWRSYGSRSVLLSPAPAASLARAPRPRAHRP